MRVGVLGANGRMGSAIREAIDESDDFEYTKLLVDRSGDGPSVLPDELLDVDVVVDVSTAEAAAHNLPVLAASGVDAVVGTTGFSDATVKELDKAFKKAKKRCFLVPNFAIGAVLMMRFAAEAAQHFDGVEIVELHHDQKKDAPSGTAKLTAERIGGEVPIHSVRLRGLVAHQEVIFGTTGQTLTIRHDSYDRSAFLPGVLLALGKLQTLKPGVTSGLDAVL